MNRTLRDSAYLIVVILGATVLAFGAVVAIAVLGVQL